MSNNFIVGDISNTGVTIKTVDTGAGHESVHVLADVGGVCYINTYGMPMQDARTTPKGFFQNTTLSTTARDIATLLGASVPADARIAWIQPEGGDIRLRDDGTSPTVSAGFRIFDGTGWPYTGDFDACQLIAITGTVTINILFYS